MYRSLIPTEDRKDSWKKTWESLFHNSGW